MKQKGKSLAIFLTYAAFSGPAMLETDWTNLNVFFFLFFPPNI